MSRAPIALALLLGLLTMGESASAARRPDVTLPFESANLGVYVQVTLPRSVPRWFLLDTGVKPALVDLGIARSIGLELGDSVAVGGGGKDAVTGYLLRGGEFGLAGLEGFRQPLFLALPLGDLSRVAGREIAGVIGYDFIRQFVVEIDYVRRTLTLHDKDAWTYRGKGESFPITFNAAAHPQVRGQVLIERGSAPVDGTFVVDIGSGASLILNRPFVEEHRLLAERRTVPWLEGRGLGGTIDGSVGRLEGLRLGRFLIRNPVVVFSRAESGPFASAEAQGNIGAAVLDRFRIFLDYERKRVILEPGGRRPEPSEYNRSGLALVATGPGYRTYSIAAIADGSPAREAGLQVGDTLVAVDGRPTGDRPLSEIRLLLQHAKRCELTVERDGRRLRAGLVPRSPI